MKKLMVCIVGALTFTMVFLFSIQKTEYNLNQLIAGWSITEKIAEANPDCPNGCLIYPGHCWCYGYYPNLEKNWDDDQPDPGGG
ncbi:MAG TPA: hypothetical protein VKZ54_03125 [Membranihabitans sp.]|nr:hypothetical protein [Membranihabitans sp.]